MSSDNRSVWLVRLLWVVRWVNVPGSRRSARCRIRSTNSSDRDFEILQPAGDVGVPGSYFFPSSRRADAGYLVI